MQDVVSYLVVNASCLFSGVVLERRAPVPNASCLSVDLALRLHAGCCFLVVNASRLLVFLALQAVHSCQLVRTAKYCICFTIAFLSRAAGV